MGEGEICEIAGITVLGRSLLDSIRGRVSRAVSLLQLLFGGLEVLLGVWSSYCNSLFSSCNAVLSY